MMLPFAPHTRVLTIGKQSISAQRRKIHPSVPASAVQGGLECHMLGGLGDENAPWDSLLGECYRFGCSFYFFLSQTVSC